MVRTQLGDTVVIVARFDDTDSRLMTLQDFRQPDGRAFIPVFSDDEHFKAEIAGSGFERQGVEIQRAFFVSLLKGDERFILNPASDNLAFSKAELEAGVIEA